MVLEEMNAIYSPWSLLQQPAHASRSMHAAYRALLAAIDQGWQVETPVQVLPSAHSDTWTYYFTLSHASTRQTCRLFVPATAEVQRFVERSAFSVIEGSTY